MNLVYDPGAIVHSIQLAVAPVFLLTAVSGMIGTVAHRLARIVDRARVLEAFLHSAAQGPVPPSIYRELALLRTRGWLVTLCIGLLTLCGFLIGLTILFLFLGQTTEFDSPSWAVGSFLAGVMSFLLALVLFFVETVAATRILIFGRRPRHP
ncbi:MAG: DUF2721 domain-containing protein [Burkholderiaceae bacterium]|nr:DUF2721 domain-containing protein [Burkholderiaceae bacterium]